ncbi:MAG TPA: DedA family protein [Steroidobacteraceae bacterium]|jgi:membrane protein DedA with SNARE-associated domain|nr:DedA family protein [Steroidobacteraceae bacterium]
MDLPVLLEHFGYLLIFLGTFAEGESLLVLGGYLAHRGYLDLGGVIATAFFAAVCGDQLFFHLGRRHANRLFERFPRLHDKVRVAVHRAERHQNLVVLGMRFLWGLRIALPLAMGMTRMNAQKFFWLNLLSAAVWSVLFACIGYGTSRLFESVVDDLHRYELWVAGALLFMGAVVLGIRWIGARRPERLGD